MSLHRLFVLVLVMIALPFAATQAFARSGDGARARAVRTPEDDAQMRELLAKLAAASGELVPEERTDADLMYEAMLRWNGEPPGSAAVERLLEQSKKESARSKRATVDKVRSMFWKDPFSDEPAKLVPVRQEDRDLLAVYERRNQRRTDVRPTRAPQSEVSRLRAELVAARAEAAAVRAENARILERADATSQRRSCVADASPIGEVRRRRRSGGGTTPSRQHTDHVRAEITLASTAPAARQLPAPPVTQQPPAPPPVPAAPIPAHGMIIVPLASPAPPPPTVVAEKWRRSRSSSRSTR